MAQQLLLIKYLRASPNDVNFPSTGIHSNGPAIRLQLWWSKNSFPKNVRNICRNYLSTNPKKQPSQSQHTKEAAIFASQLLHVSQPPYLGNLPEFGSWYSYSKEKGFICFQASLCWAGGWDLAQFALKICCHRNSTTIELSENKGNSGTDGYLLEVLIN